MSLFLTRHVELTPEEYIFCGHIPSPFLSSHPISLLLCPCTCSSLIRSQRGHERLRPALRWQQERFPGPGSPLASCVPSHTAPPLPQAFVTLLSTAWPGSDAAFLLALGPSALPLFLFPFVYGTQSSSRAMRKCSALGQVEFLSRKIAQEFRAGAPSQACWAGCFVLSAPVLLEDLLA